MSEPDVATYLGDLQRDGDCTGYLFRCVQCGENLAYADCS